MCVQGRGTMKSFAWIMALGSRFRSVENGELRVERSTAAGGRLPARSTLNSAPSTQQRRASLPVVASGIAAHPDLVPPTNRITGWKDLINGKTSPYDDYGHGTHVAGIIAGSGGAAAKAGRDLRGMAPGANLIGVKVLDANGQSAA